MLCRIEKNIRISFQLSSLCLFVLCGADIADSKKLALAIGNWKKKKEKLSVTEAYDGTENQLYCEKSRATNTSLTPLCVSPSKGK